MVIAVVYMAFLFDVSITLGLCQQVKEMEEFSLAWKDDNAETFINGELHSATRMSHDSHVHVT